MIGGKLLNKIKGEYLRIAFTMFLIYAGIKIIIK